MLYLGLVWDQIFSAVQIGKKLAAGRVGVGFIFAPRPRLWPHPTLGVQQNVLKMFSSHARSAAEGSKNFLSSLREELAQ